MDLAALILWILTAGGGFYLLGTWIAHGGARRSGAGSTFPPGLIFGHFLLAAVGLILWIAYVVTGSDGAGWPAFALLAVVALLGFTMFARWLPTYRSPGRPEAQGGPAERHFPVPIVAGHGLLAASTLVLVVLALVTG